MACRQSSKGQMRSSSRLRSDPRNRCWRILQDFQREFRYVPEEGMKRLSEVLDVPESKIYAMGTFYKALSLEPRGKHTVKVCMGTACHLKGAGQILEAIERGSRASSGTTPPKDMNVHHRERELRGGLRHGAGGRGGRGLLRPHRGLPRSLDVLNKYK
ncbi:MAG: NAD(P)H-dependent oxidoreductase subunit E [Anaerotruncus sp.]|nr:NAD(P)H-dependent oxidoreductase subunit E [Anaerotruncus sp.]